MIAALADTGDPWRWQPHPEVWLLLAGVIGLGLYVTRVIAPKVVDEGQVAVTRRQKGFFVAGVLTLWVSSDFPLHDLGENNLYVLHMIQHFSLTMVVPPLFLLSVPTWLARLVFPDGSQAKATLRKFGSPVAITVLFTAWSLFTHWPPVVSTSVEVGPVHYLVHLVSVSLALGMWNNVCGPWPEWRLSPPNQCVYLFVQSLAVILPSAWVTLADSPVYDVYDHLPRLWGISVITDQQYAGLFMQVFGGMYLWAIILYVFFRWSLSKEQTDQYVTLTADQASAYEAAGMTEDNPVSPSAT
jgi:putative membrane protein